ncbi:hypothetical protein J2Z66_008676 [Paenibacillus eucommiae]|uniref:Uncharacterized protein n=1 Tax=Paenibacillus eucommiae TaxID=1355755 RepID=A0ABS4JAX4_9BACL|nr:hypothetical protein [Paenibacillus eucommiae]
MLLTMKNIVKAADPAQLLTLARGGGRSSSPAPLLLGKSPPIKRKPLLAVGLSLVCSFDSCDSCDSCDVAREREWLWAEERERPPLKICSYPLIHSIQGNKSLTAAGVHSHSLRNAPKSRTHTSKDAAKAFSLLNLPLSRFEVSHKLCYPFCIGRKTAGR